MLRILVLLSFLLAKVSMAATATYVLNTDHSQIQFSVSYMHVSSVNGAFTDFNGLAQIDQQNRPLKFHLKIGTKSLTTFEKKRDHHLKKEDFFWVNRHPVIEFTSTEIRYQNEKLSTIQGHLLFQEKEHPATFKVQYLGSKIDPWGKESLFYSFEGVINRRELGLHWNRALEAGEWLVGEEVTVQGQFQFQKEGEGTAFSTHMVPGPRAGQAPRPRKERPSIAEESQQLKALKAEQVDASLEEVTEESQSSVYMTTPAQKSTAELVSLIIISTLAFAAIIALGIGFRFYIEKKWAKHRMAPHFADALLILAVFLFALAVEQVF